MIIQPDTIERWKDLMIEAPSPEEIQAIRRSVGLTHSQAAMTIGIGNRTSWAEFESGEKKPSKQTWTIFLLAIKKHPIFTLEVRT